MTDPEKPPKARKPPIPTLAYEDAWWLLARNNWGLGTCGTIQVIGGDRRKMVARLRSLRAVAVAGSVDRWLVTCTSVAEHDAGGPLNGVWDVTWEPCSEGEPTPDCVATNHACVEWEHPNLLRGMLPGRRQRVD